MRKRITIGIPCYQNVAAETLEDYMRFAYYLGRRMVDYDFFLAIKSKSEQFRARNAIVEAAQQVGSDYLLFLDDDHVIEWQGQTDASPAYGFLRKLLDADKDIVGALYYQRGGECRPVFMYEGDVEGTYRWANDHEVKGELQEVAVTGGGCMLIKMGVFDKLPQPYFVPETDLGTDVQICRNAAQEGMSVFCHTGIELAHVKSERTLVTSRNRHQHFQSTQWKSMVNREWAKHAVYNRYLEDVLDYTQLSPEDINDAAQQYNDRMSEWHAYDNPDEYYRSRGVMQLARQAWFHSQPVMLEQLDAFLAMVDASTGARGLDFGCGSAPLGFELALRGCDMTFCDLDGAYAYEFTKWRAQRYANVRCDFLPADSEVAPSEAYDFILMMDSLEHIHDWQEALTWLCGALKPGGFILTNFFLIDDGENLEHVNMDHDGVRDFLISRRIYPFTDTVWVNRADEKAA